MAGRPDPGSVRTRAELGHELTSLRKAAGLTVRELARRLDVPPATLGDYFAGRHLPKPSQLELFRAVVTECGVPGPELEHWVEALERARTTSDGRTARTTSPYRGLEPFGEADAGLFFGREAATTELLDRLRALRDDPGPSNGILVLVGPSGSGKSSLLGAGLLPAVRAGALDTGGRSWTCELTSPSAAMGQLSPTATARGGGGHQLLIIDQFEEILASASLPREAVLAALSQSSSRPHLIVLGLRADYYGSAAGEPAIAAALRHAQMLLGPMTEPEVCEAVIGPAKAVGAVVEDGLVDLVLADLAPGSPTGFAHGAGALPLLSHALHVTWERAQRNELTIADYRAVGGLRGAVRQSAEELYSTLPPDEQGLARSVFTRLVRLEADGPPARRRVQRQELIAIEASAEVPGPAERVLEKFLAARLLTADARDVAISHEALLHAWPRLAEWVDADRAGLLLHHRIADAAGAWKAAGSDESLLWRGTALAAAAEWAQDPGHEATLTTTEREFLSLAVARREAEELAARRRTRRTQRSRAVMAALALVASALAAYAFQARSDANRTRNQALSRQVAIESQQLRASDPSLAAQLALAGYRISPTVQATSALLEASGGELPTRLLGPVGPEFLATDASGRLLAVAQSADDSVQLYALAHHHVRRAARVTVGPASGQDFALALSPNGGLLAAGDTGGHITVWNVTVPAHPIEVTHLGPLSSTVYALAFGPGGHRLAAADANGTIGQWDLSHPTHPITGPTVRVPGSPAMHAVAYSPAGHLAVAAGANGAMVAWTPGLASPTVVGSAGTSTINSLAFNPDGTMVASGGSDDEIRVWRVGASGQLQVAHPPLSPGPAYVRCVAFGPHGRTLAACSQNSVVVYDTSTWSEEGSVSAPSPPTAALFSPNGSSLTTGDAGGATRIWSLPLPTSAQVSGNVFDLQYTAGRKLLDSVTSGPNGDVTFWNVESPLHPTETATITMPANFGPVAGAGMLSPDGHLLAVADARAAIQLVDVSDVHHPRPLGPPLQEGHPYVEQFAFSPDGTILAAGDDSGRVRMWDVADPSTPKALPTIRGTKGEILGLAFSHDGRLLATASSDTKVRLYSVANPARPRLLATLGGFAGYAYDVAFTPSNRTLVAGSADGTIRLWDVANPARPRPLGSPLTGLTGYVYQIALSPHGRLLAGATTDHTVGLWDIADPAAPKHLATLDVGTGQLFAVAFGPRSHTLVASGDEHTLALWDSHASDATHLVCTRTGDPITRAEWAEYIQGAPYRPPCRP